MEPHVGQHSKVSSLISKLRQIILLTPSSTVEVDVGILCSCMPCFPSIFKRTNILQSLLAPFRSLVSHLSNSRKSSTGESALKKARSPGSGYSGSSQFSYPSRPRKDCIEYGDTHVFGNSAVKVACVTKPEAVIRGSSLMRGFGHSFLNEKGGRDREFHEPVRQHTDPYR